VYGVVAGTVERLISSMLDVDFEGFEERFRLVNALHRVGRLILGLLEAVHLVGVEYPVVPRHRNARVLWRLRVQFLGLEELPEDDVRRHLALPDLCANLLPLLLGRPDAEVVTLLLCGRPKDQHVDSATRHSANGVDWRCGEQWVGKVTGQEPVEGESPILSV